MRFVGLPLNGTKPEVASHPGIYIDEAPCGEEKYDCLKLAECRGMNIKVNELCNTYAYEIASCSPKLKKNWSRKPIRVPSTRAKSKPFSSKGIIQMFRKFYCQSLALPNGAKRVFRVFPGRSYRLRLREEVFATDATRVRFLGYLLTQKMYFVVKCLACLELGRLPIFLQSLLLKIIESFAHN